MNWKYAQLSTDANARKDGETPLQFAPQQNGVDVEERLRVAGFEHARAA